MRTVLPSPVAAVALLLVLCFLPCNCGDDTALYPWDCLRGHQSGSHNTHAEADSGSLLNMTQLDTGRRLTVWTRCQTPYASTLYSFYDVQLSNAGRVGCCSMEFWTNSWIGNEKRTSGPWLPGPLSAALQEPLFPGFRVLPLCVSVRRGTGSGGHGGRPVPACLSTAAAPCLPAHGGWGQGQFPLLGRKCFRPSTRHWSRAVTGSFSGLLWGTWYFKGHRNMHALEIPTQPFMLASEVTLDCSSSVIFFPNQRLWCS